MRLLKCFLVILLLSSFVKKAKQPDHVIAITAQQMTTDNLGNVYLINKESITKYDQNGTLLKSFSNKKYGPITSADATNPLRILLYYRDFARVIFLDDMMSPIGDEVKLETLGFPMTTCVASSHDNGLWILDQQNSELVRLNRNLQVENRTGNLYFSTGKKLQAEFLIEKNNRLIMSDTASGIYFFDIYGTYNNWTPLKGFTSFQVNDDAVIYFKSGKLFASPIEMTGDLKTYEEPVDEQALNMRIEKNAVYVLDKDSLRIYDRPGQ